MRVLFTTTPGWGHVHPMVPLARAFLERGDDVRWAAAADVCSRLEGEGFDTSAAGLSEVRSLAMFYERFPEAGALPPTERPLFMFPRVFGLIRAGPMLADLLPVARDWEPTVVVREAGEFAGSIVAAVMGVPSVTHGFGVLLPAERVAAAAAAVAPLWEAQGLQPRPFGGSYDHLYLDIYPESLQLRPRPHVPAVAPLRPVAFAVAGDEALPGRVAHDWLTAEPRSALVYVTFGTVFNTDVSLIAAVVAGLSDLPMRVLVTLGPHADPAVLGPQPPNVLVARYIPQTQLLPSCAAVVSHGGSGTFLAGLGHGLPQLCIPQGADQFDNATACAGAGAGICLPPGTATPEAVRAAMEDLLSDTRYRIAAAAVGREIAGMPGPDVVAGVIEERFVR